MRPSFDAIVLGGGPAGSAAAVLLARLSARTVVLNKTRARHRRGEILDSRALGLLRKIGLSDGTLQSVFTAVPGHFVEWGAAVQESSAITNPHGPGMIVDRDGFDSRLRCTASQAGAIVLELERAPKVERAHGGWSATVYMNDRAVDVHAPILVDCTGRRASIVRRYGQRKRVDRLICDYYLTNTGRADSDSRWCLAADEHGWWFTVRIDPGTRVFCRFHDQASRRIDTGFDFASSDCHISNLALELNCKVRQFARVDASTSTFDVDQHALASAGDAAFTIDPLSGQGTSLAIAQGLLAAGACLEHLGGSRSALSYLRTLQNLEYRAALRRRMLTYATCTRWKQSSFWNTRQIETREMA